MHNYAFEKKIMMCKEVTAQWQKKHEMIAYRYYEVIYITE